MAHDTAIVSLRTGALFGDSWRFLKAFHEGAQGLVIGCVLDARAFDDGMLELMPDLICFATCAHVFVCNDGTMTWEARATV